MDYQIIKQEVKEQVLILTIDRESKYNALNIQFFGEMDQILDRVYSDDSIRSVLLTGAGTKAFAAGADITEFSNFGSRQALKLSRDGHNVLNRIESCPKPFLAAVNGFALGGGCELAMACHIRIASSNATFGQPEVNLGLIPGYGGTQRLIQLIGKGKALELLLTADSITADQALSLGLVSKVVPIENLIDTSLQMLNKINTKAPIAIEHIIKTVNSHFNDGPIGYTTEINSFAECFDTEDFKEGVAAFAEKRKANFRGI